MVSSTEAHIVEGEPHLAPFGADCPTGAPNRVRITTSPTQDDDVADLSSAARGDRAALARLYDRHAPLLLGLGIHLIGDEALSR